MSDPNRTAEYLRVSLALKHLEQAQEENVIDYHLDSAIEYLKERKIKLDQMKVGK